MVLHIFKRGLLALPSDFGKAMREASDGRTVTDTDSYAFCDYTVFRLLRGIQHPLNPTSLFLMKKLIFAFLLSGITGLSLPHYTYAFDGGDGTEDNPFIISDVSHLDDIRNHPSASFILSCDIQSYTPPISLSESYTFKGNFDGNGHRINLNHQVDYEYYKITNGAVPYAAGLFSKCEGATIKNLTLSGVLSFGNRNTSGGESPHFWGYNQFTGLRYDVRFWMTRMYVGAFCGSAINTTFINCHNEAMVDGHVIDYLESTYLGYGSDAWVGGLVGKASECHLSECSNTGNVSANYMTTAWLDYKGYIDNEVAGISGMTCGAGGLIGNDSGSTIINCFSNCEINHNGMISHNSLNAGGLIAETNSTNIISSYSKGEIASWSKYGPFVGTATATSLSECISATEIAPIYDGIHYDNCYLTSAIETRDGCNPVKIEMLSIRQWYLTNCLKWDFNEIWYIPPTGNSLPHFKTLPSITSIGETLYGQTLLFKSSNTSSDLKILSSDPKMVAITNNTVKLLQAGDIELRIRQEPASSFKSIDKFIRLSVSKVQLEIVARNHEVTYGDEVDLSNAIEYIGFVNNDDCEQLLKKPQILCDATSLSDAGMYNMIPYGAEATNYDIIFTPGILSITKAPLHIKVLDASRKTGEPNPSFKMTFSGFRNDDNETSLNTLPEIICDADMSSPAGTYPIVLSGGYDNNYDYNLTNGLLTIEDESSLDDIFYNSSDNPTNNKPVIYRLDGQEIHEDTSLAAPGVYIYHKNGKAYKVYIR